MPAARRGYRVDRLRRRRRGKTQRLQTWVLVTLAVIVAFVAVLGAWYAATRWLGSAPQAKPAGALTLLQLTEPGSHAPVAAALVVRDTTTGSSALYVVPRDLLVQGPHGEYVFAGDAMAAGTLKEDLGRVVGAPIDAAYTIPADSLVRLAGAQQLQLTMADPASVQVAGAERRFQDGALVPAADVPSLFAAAGPTGYDASRLQEALWSALVGAAAVRPAAELKPALAGVAAASGSIDTAPLTAALQELASGQAPVARFPSDSQVSEGQFAFTPNADQVMAEIRRHSPSYRSRYTVLVENGSGEVGVGKAVAGQLAVLDVNLPPVVNADTFDYRQTRILAGRNALRVAEDVRAILGRGVVLDSSAVPADSVIVIVGADTRLNETQPKDQQ
jgi:hypothetical protein